MKLHGTDLNAIRDHHKTNTLAISEAVGISRKTLRNWENDIGTPNVNELFLFCDVCGIDSMEFIGLLKKRGSIKVPVNLKAAEYSQDCGNN